MYFVRKASRRGKIYMTFLFLKLYSYACRNDRIGVTLEPDYLEVPSGVCGNGEAKMKQLSVTERCLSACRSYQHRLNLRPASGFTITELIVVLFIIGALIAIGAKGFIAYNEEYAFSNAVRKLNHAIALAQVRAIQSQNNTWLLVRPLQSAQNPLWQAGKTYSPYQIIDDGRATYCYVGTATPPASAGYTGNEPGVGVTGCPLGMPLSVCWKNLWTEIADYQYNAAQFAIQDCTTGTCIDASTYSLVSTNTPPVLIKFNWFGLPADSSNHILRITAADQQYAGKVQFTVTSMGQILQGSW